MANKTKWKPMGASLADYGIAQPLRKTTRFRIGDVANDSPIEEHRRWINIANKYNFNTYGAGGQTLLYFLNNLNHPITMKDLYARLHKEDPSITLGNVKQYMGKIRRALDDSKSVNLEKILGRIYIMHLNHPESTNTPSTLQNQM